MGVNNIKMGYMMELQYKEGKLTFIVDTLCSIGLEHKGGSIAVHKLAYEIASKGHQVYIFNNPLYPHKNINVIPTTKHIDDNGLWANFTWDSFTYNPQKTITVYTQITWGNPFGTTHNCRWVLHDLDKSHWETFDKNDVIYNYAAFEIPENIKQEKLTILDYKLNLFKNYKRNRKGYCYILHKYTPSWGQDFMDKFGATNVTEFLVNGDFKELVNKFNEFEYLITFDYKTYITTAAALCGCKAIILNNDKSITPLEYRLNNPTQMCGIAYGWDDIEWANQTIKLTKKNIEELEKSDKKTINDFIDYWSNKLI